MKGRKMRKKLKSDKLRDNTRAAAVVKSANFEQETWADLSVELLELIFSRLVVADNIRASIVCKTWNSVATCVRPVNQSPWLMYFPKNDNRYDFYHPVLRKTYSLEFPELDGCHVLYTKDGWLLVCCGRWWPDGHPFYFFNPFTRELIKLPRLYDTNHIAAFSCAPTLTECVIFTLKNVSSTIVAISTCYPGANKWTTVHLRNCSHFSCCIITKVVFSNGLFYCLSRKGFLGVFDPVECTWTVLEVSPPRSLKSFVARRGRKGKFMTEHEGNIFVIHVFCPEGPIIFKLDQTLMEWKEVRTLDGVTVFASFLSSHSKTYVTEIMRNSVYFSKVRFYGKRCISFSLDDHRYYPNKLCHDWIEPDAFESIWIEPPKEFVGWM
ncbi:unnamed protein product [Vicia faba]|uniref:F-box domain-containing protein n=1 Tax=Vicia faba TaxID=3906 RepID=A0AAV1B0B3_VICFA|nr:unnamed protein product [Vicia faba]